MSLFLSSKFQKVRIGVLAQNIELLEWKWEMINMDIITGLPRSRMQHDFIWVIVDIMTKSSHFLLVNTTYSIEDYAKMYKSRGGKTSWCLLLHYFI